MPTPDTPATDLRTALLDAAEAQLVEEGLGSLSLRAIARNVGVSHQAPGHHFGNRAGLMTAVAARGVARLGRRMEEVAASSSGSARERLSAIGVAYVEFADQHRALFALAARPELIDASDEGLLQARLAAWGVLAAAVADAQAEGWRADEPTEDVAMLCWTVVHGTATLWRDGMLSIQQPGLSLHELATATTSAL